MYRYNFWHIYNYTVFVCSFVSWPVEVNYRLALWFTLFTFLVYIVPPEDCLLNSLLMDSSFVRFFHWSFCGHVDPCSSHCLEVSVECHQAVRFLFPGGLSSPIDVWEPPLSLTLCALETSFPCNILRNILTFDVKTWTMTFLRDFNVFLFLCGVAKMRSLWLIIC